MPSVEWYATGEYWNTIPGKIPAMVERGFNVVRMRVGGADFRTLAADASSLISVLDQLNDAGLRGIIDLHNFRDLQGHFGSQAWRDNWLALVNQVKGHPGIAAYELFNEPWANIQYPDVPEKQVWARGITSYEQAFDAIEALSADIRAIEPGATIVYPPPWNSFLGPGMPADRANTIMGFHFWEWHMYGSKGPPDDPIEQAIENAIVFADNYVTQAQDWMARGFRVLISETGGYMSPSIIYPAQRAFLIRVLGNSGTGFLIHNYSGYASRYDEILDAIGWVPPTPITPLDYTWLAMGLAPVTAVVGTVTIQELIRARVIPA